MATSTITNSSDYKVNVQQIEDTDSTGSQYKSNATVTADSISGYYPIGVVGLRERTIANVLFYGLYIDAGYVYYSWQTINNSVVKNHKFDVYVLYKKN